MHLNFTDTPQLERGQGASNFSEKISVSFFMILHVRVWKTKWIKRGNKVQKQFKQKHFHEL